MKITAIALLVYLAKPTSSRLLATEKDDDYSAIRWLGGGEESGCVCKSDYDCKPKCDIYTGFCVGTVEPPSPAPPTPPPVLEPTPGNDGCPCPRPKMNIPTVCEVQLIIEMLDIAVAGNHKLAAQWLRASFHDAGTFDQGVPEGGANGCLMNDPAFLNIAFAPENAHLDPPVTTLRTIKHNWENHPSTCLDVSSADIIQFAGLFATVRQRVSSSPGSVAGVMDPAKEAQLLAFLWGREDEPNCDAAWTNNLPGFSAGLGLPITGRCPASALEIEDKMINRNGFSDEEATALLGAHTIGLVRNTFGPGLAGAWVKNGEDNATPDGPVFDNAYHDFLKNTIAANTVPNFQANTFPFDQDFGDWFRVSMSGPPGLTDLDHLDTDIAIAFPPQGPPHPTHPDFSVHTTAFAGNNALFLDKFDQAYLKMSILGVTVPLFDPTECCDEAKSIDIDVDGVITLIRDLGNATAYAEKKLDFNQEVLAEERKKKTTVVDEKHCDEDSKTCESINGESTPSQTTPRAESTTGKM